MTHRDTPLPPHYPSVLKLALLICATMMVSLALLMWQSRLAAGQEPPPPPDSSARTEADDINEIIDASIRQLKRPRDLSKYSEVARFNAAAWALCYQAQSCDMDSRFAGEVQRCCDALTEYAPEFLPYAPPCWR